MKIKEKISSSKVCCPKCKEYFIISEKYLKCKKCFTNFLMQDKYAVLLIEDEDDKSFKHKMFYRNVYNRINTTINQSSYKRFVKFQNWGYVSKKVEHEYSALNNSSISLLKEVIEGVEFENKDLLDISCGRNGNLSYIEKMYNLRNIYGVDISDEAIKFSVSRKKDDSISYFVADAENLPFRGDQFDIVLNIESSGAYFDLKKFATNVYNVLRVGGYFLFAGVLPKVKHESFLDYLKSLGFIVKDKKDITQNILLSREYYSEVEFDLLASKDLQNNHELKETLATPDSQMYKLLENDKFQYKILRLVKL